MNKTNFAKKMTLISESYIENPLLVETTEQERKQTLGLVAETLNQRHQNDPATLLKEYHAAALILEANETYSKNMEQLEDVMQDLLSLKSYFAPHESKLPSLTQGIDKAIAKMQAAEDEITQRTNGLLGGIKGSIATRNEAIDRAELSPLDSFLMELGGFTPTTTNIPRFAGPNGPAAALFGSLGDANSFAQGAGRRGAHRAGDQMLTNDQLQQALAAKESVATKAMDVADKAGTTLDILKNTDSLKNAASMSQMKGVGASAKLGVVPSDGGIVSSLSQTGQSIWAKLGAIFTKAGFMKLLSVGIPVAAIYGLYRWLKQRTVILNKIINFTMALAAILKTLYRQSKVLGVESDKTKKVGDVASVGIDGAIRNSASRTKGVFAGFRKLFQNTKPEDFSEFMSVATFTQEIKMLTIAEFLDIFNNPKMVDAFDGSQIADLQQAKTALKALDSQVAAVNSSPAGAPVAPAGTPPPPPVTQSQGASSTPLPALVASLAPHDNVFSPGVPSAQEVDTELQAAIAANVLTPAEASQVVANIAALDAQIQNPAVGGKLIGRLEGFLAEPGLERLREVIAMHFISGCTLLKTKRVAFAVKYPRVKGALGGSDLKTALAFRLFNVAATRAVMSAAQMQTLLTPLFAQAGLDPMAVEAMVPASDPKGLTETLVAKEIYNHKKIKTEFKSLFSK